MIEDVILTTSHAFKRYFYQKKEQNSKKEQIKNYNAFFPSENSLISIDCNHDK